MHKIQNYHSGKLFPLDPSKSLSFINPATGHELGQLPQTDQATLEAAIASAEKAFPDWSINRKRRLRVLHKLATLIEENLPELAKLECENTGKPLSLASTVDIPRSARNFRFFADSISTIASQSHHGRHTINYTLRKPLGIVGCISPWNLPLYLFTWKIAPALAAGNCVIGKPSEVTPLTAYKFSELCLKSGMPPGVLSILHGTGPEIGEAIVRHPKVKAISFTGGTKTGKHLAAIAATELKKFSLELGGKNPNIIFADCDKEKMLTNTIRSSFSNQGQICLCGSRILVEKTYYEQFKQDFVAATEALTVGDPEEANTKVGAVVSEAHYNKIIQAIDLAKQEGGTILTGGEPVYLEGKNEGGFFIRPTIIEGLPPDCQTNQQEIFGPVVTLIPFEDEKQALEIANCTRYGLSTSIWTSNLNRAHSMADQIEAGIVWINCWMLRDLRTPFGGMKDSGMGREGGKEAWEFFTEPKNVCIDFS